MGGKLVAPGTGGPDAEKDRRIVIVLDDDQAILASLDRLLTANGYHVRLHHEPDGFFLAGPPAAPCCLLLDNQLGNGRTGMDVHAELRQRCWDIPTVFLTAHWDVRLVVSTMKAGADGFLTKPYDPSELILAVSGAFERSGNNRRAGHQLADLRGRVSSLSTRELEIVRLVASGMLNKEIADVLGIALVTVKVHRGRAMQKLGAGNAAELARLASLAGIIS
jgi:FixJ family two-component response regulator